MEHVLDIIRNEASRNQGGPAENPIQSKVPIDDTQGEDAIPSMNSSNPGGFVLPSNDSFDTMSCPPSAGLMGMPLNYQVPIPNYAESIARYSTARTNSDSGFLTAASGSELNHAQPGLESNIVLPSTFPQSQSQQSSSARILLDPTNNAATYPMLLGFASETYPRFEFPQDNNIEGMDFGPNSPINLDTASAGPDSIDSNAIWHGSNGLQRYQRSSNLDQGHSQSRLKGRENRGLDDGEDGDKLI
ncbi:hypothetical protein K505DRAFT_93471 [Melanomma pulvis-pyrius CBS 109.77]|uniref:Uncharacterized protein n=1 Tax=Melanomma pulvis-pyrius CBS 109.77 TaxID=1314802 RepID=A0A6A6WZ20_9PLEO|nr:hypothetical protein K505DRAFT_93471 [Melanomma pulvis-pyrius CBS 109.77]